MILARRTHAQYRGKLEGEVEDHDRLIAHNKHEFISYVKSSGRDEKTSSDLKIVYRSDLDYIEIDQVPQYFKALSDDAVEKEVQYRTQHGRWSDRVILEKVYFGLLHGKSGFPDRDIQGHDDYDDVSACREILNVDEGWNVFVRDDDFCEWNGITCKKKKVTGIRLNENDFKGTLTEDIQYLSHLDYIDLKGETGA